MRVIVQADVPTDQVSEAGPAGAQALSLFTAFTDVQQVVVDDIAQLRWDSLPGDERMSVLVPTRRDRYGAPARHWRPALHIVLWNPFQVLDVDAPALLTWGFAEGVHTALRHWLEGRADAPGHSPVSLDSGVELST